MNSEQQTLLPNENSSILLSRKTKIALAIVLAAETLERVAFYSLVGNLVLFLNLEPLNWMSYNAAATMFLFTGISCASALFGGWLADSYTGKYVCIVVFLTVYLIGYLAFPLFTWGSDSKDGVFRCFRNHSNHTVNGTVAQKDSSEDVQHMWMESCFPIVFTALFIIAVGNGCVKANISAFGADQV